MFTAAVSYPRYYKNIYFYDINKPVNLLHGGTLLFRVFYIRIMYNTVYKLHLKYNFPRFMGGNLLVRVFYIPISDYTRVQYSNYILNTIPPVFVHACTPSSHITRMQQCTAVIQQHAYAHVTAANRRDQGPSPAAPRGLMAQTAGRKRVGPPACLCSLASTQAQRWR